MQGMTAIFYIDTSRETIIEKFTGKVTLPGIQKVFPHIWNHPDYRVEYDGIIDFRACQLDFKSDELRQLIQSVASSDKGMRGRAAVMVSEPVAAAMGVIYSEGMREVHPSSIFCSNSEVELYLNIDPGIFDQLSNPGAIHIRLGD